MSGGEAPLFQRAARQCGVAPSPVLRRLGKGGCRKINLPRTAQRAVPTRFRGSIRKKFRGILSPAPSPINGGERVSSRSRGWIGAQAGAPVSKPALRERAWQITPMVRGRPKPAGKPALRAGTACHTRPNSACGLSKPDLCRLVTPTSMARTSQIIGYSGLPKAQDHPFPRKPSGN